MFLNLLICLSGRSLFTLSITSAGVGRTGTFITIDAMLQRLKKKDDLNIFVFVTEMRSKRTFMVQNQVRA